MVFTGTELIVFNGSLGARYLPGPDTWQQISPVTVSLGSSVALHPGPASMWWRSVTVVGEPTIPSMTAGSPPASRPTNRVTQGAPLFGPAPTSWFKQVPAPGLVPSRRHSKMNVTRLGQH